MNAGPEARTFAVDPAPPGDWHDWEPLPRPAHRPTVAVPRTRDLDAVTSLTEVPDGPDIIGPGTEPGTSRVRFVVTAPEATAVALLVRAWYHASDVHDCELERVAGTDRWAATYQVPDDWQVSYRIALHHGTDEPSWRSTGLRGASGAGRADPARPRHHTAVGGQPSSVLWLPAAGDRGWLERFGTGPVPDPLPTAVLGGDGPRVWWSIAGQPDNARAVDTPLPLLVLFDGRAHAEGLGTASVLDDAVTAGLLPPLAVVMIDSGTPQQRARTLGVPGGLADLVGARLLPRLVADGLPGGVAITADPARTVVSGSSFGGLSTLFALARHPERIGAGVAQSPSLWRYPPGALTAPLAAVPTARIRVQAGHHEGNMVPDAEQLVAATSAAGCDIRLRAVSGGHDWAWWLPEMVTEVAALLATGH